MGVVEEDKGQYDTIIPVFWATGAALFIRLKDYREAGGWTDDSLPTWKRLTCAGGFVHVAGRLYVCRKVWFIM